MNASQAEASVRADRFASVSFLHAFSHTLLKFMVVSRDVNDTVDTRFGHAEATVRTLADIIADIETDETGESLALMQWGALGDHARHESRADVIAYAEFTTTNMDSSSLSALGFNAMDGVERRLQGRDCSEDRPCGYVSYSTPARETNETDNMLESKEYQQLMRIMIKAGECVFGPSAPGFSENFPVDWHDIVHDQGHESEGNLDLHNAEEHSHDEIAASFHSTRPTVSLACPVFSRMDDSVKGMVVAVVAWEQIIGGILPRSLPDIEVIAGSECDRNHTFSLHHGSVVYKGEVDAYDPYVRITGNASLLLSDSLEVVYKYEKECAYTVTVASAQATFQTGNSNAPLIFACCVAGVFAILVIAFIAYERWVQRKSNLIIQMVVKSNKVLSSLFPSMIRERLFKNMDKSEDSEPTDAYGKLRAKYEEEKGIGKAKGTDGLNEFLHAYEDGQLLRYDSNNEKPIADLFPVRVNHRFRRFPHFRSTHRCRQNCTVMFADLVGFTAWSSTREPSQVFFLLESVFSAFDKIAQRRRVFKVETIGDCYIAATGIPEPRKDHAVAMAKYAMECLTTMRTLCKDLEPTLGPDTADLNVRIGLHSGPVTAGILRGERTRFQLFGDTVNTASDMEQTSQRGRIHISPETADQLRVHGKEKWVVQREHSSTFWLRSRNDDAVSSSNQSGTDDHSTGSDDWTEQKVQNLLSEKTTRLVEWNVEIVLKMIKRISARRKTKSFSLINRRRRDKAAKRSLGIGCALDEQSENFNFVESMDEDLDTIYEKANEIDLPEELADEVFAYIQAIASMHNELPFHDFEHASHATMSMVKLMSHVESDTVLSDPWAQLACIWTSLIHHVDHRGVPNERVAEESSSLAKLYRGKHLMEQNALDLSWNLLLSEEYLSIQNAIFPTEWEKQHFRALLVNLILASDYEDPRANHVREQRWKQAFANADDTSLEAENRRALLVLEHLVQAADQAHTMQHFQIYRKWNLRLFEERCLVYRSGRIFQNPANLWYEQELEALDERTIPLVQKLVESGAFDSCDELVKYATNNRKEWEARGLSIVEEMVQLVHQGQKAETHAGRTMATRSTTSGSTISSGSFAGDSSIESMA